MYAETFRELARENTGAHFLDSGGAYGRHWEQPTISPDSPIWYVIRPISDNDVFTLTISTAAMLDDIAQIDQKATRHFRLWAALADPTDQHGWLRLAEMYTERMLETGRWQGGGLFAGNSYNEDNDLDQEFQYVAADPCAEFALVQMHNGCDVRGGYTAPVVADFGMNDGIESVEVQYHPYCDHCRTEASDLYEAERKGWTVRDVGEGAALLCPSGHASAVYPYFEA